MSPAHFIGIDPGPVPGIVMLTPRGRRLGLDVVQCSSAMAQTVLYALLTDARMCQGTAPALVQIERFVARGRMTKDQRHTADMVARLQREASDHAAVTVVLRSAANVKPWASDARLQSCITDGDQTLWTATAGMRHARDAARHALFVACRDGGVPDPLSTRSKP